MSRGQGHERCLPSVHMESACTQLQGAADRAILQHRCDIRAARMAAFQKKMSSGHSLHKGMQKAVAV